MKHLGLFLPFVCAVSAFAGTSTLFRDQQSTPFASGAATIQFNTYNASSITITVTADAYGGSQQGGGRNYGGYAEAAIGASVQREDVPRGSDPMSISVSHTVTVTKNADGNWYDGATNLGSSVSVSATAAVDGENVQGSAAALCTLTWVEIPANQAPTIVWTSTPGGVASDQTYAVSARGHDGDGNLTQVRVWQGSTLFASAGGGNGTDSEAGDSTAATGPASLTFTAQAVDATGATSATLSQTVTVAAPPVVSAAIEAAPAAATAPGATEITWSSAEATAVTVSGTGLSSTATSGRQTVTGLAAGRHTYTLTAQGYGGPVTATTTLTVTPPEPVSATLRATPTTTSAPGATTITWSSAQATAVTVTGQGLTSSAASGSQTVSNLPAGSYDYTIVAQGPDGPATATATVTVAPAALVTGSLTVTPTTGTEPAAATVVWSTSNASSVAVSGEGLSDTTVSGTQAVTGLLAGPHTYTLVAQGNGGPVTRTATIVVAAVGAVGATLSASPLTDLAPGATTITWSSANATAVTVSGTGLSSTAANGNQLITDLAAGTHTYTLTAEGPGGPVTRTATFTVSAAAAVAGSIAVSPTTATAPGATTVTWTTSDASAVVIAGPGVNSTAAAGTQAVTGLVAGTHTYTLTAQGPGGPVPRTATFTVSAPATVAGSISVSPTTTTAPGATTLMWSTANATSVLVSGPGVASAAMNGTQNVTGLAAGTHTFTLTAHGNGGPLTRTAAVTVNAGAGVTAAITAAPANLTAGGTVTLTWITANASAVRVTGFGLMGSPYQTAPALTLAVGGLPAGPSTWTLVAEGQGGPIIRTATVNAASGDGLSGSLSVSPTVITSNQSATLAWTSSGANFRWVHGQLPGPNGVSVYPAPPSGSTTVAGLAPGDYSFVFDYGPGALTPTRSAYAYLTVLGIDRTVTTAVAPVGAGAVTGGGTYRQGSSVTLAATAASSQRFTGWSGDVTGAANPLTFTVGAQNYAVVANFTPRTFAVTASVTPAGAGLVTGAGTYPAGATATLIATPDATHRWVGWTGDVSSPANPLAWVVTGDVSLVANFVATSFALTTNASAGGTVTPGGTYPAGTLVTITATPDATHRFTDWTGDVSGTATTLAVLLDRDKFAQGNFTGKTPQSIVFDPPGDHGLTSPPIALNARASSGLPVRFALLGGPAVLTDHSLQVTGVGAVTVQANQPGDAFYLPAPPVNRSFNVMAAATLTYRGESRTLLRNAATREAPPYVLEKP